MIRITTFLWVVLLVVAGGTVMHVSYKVRDVQDRLASIRAETKHEQEAIRVLSAEWQTLNDPRRIEALAKRFLILEPTPIQRVVSLDTLPRKQATDPIGRLLEAAAPPKKKEDAPAHAAIPEMAAATPAKVVVTAPFPSDVPLVPVRATQQE